MDDRQLLEDAARAYWGDEIDDVCSIEWSEEDQAIAFTHADNQDHNGCDQTFVWNPLEDDAAALRLAVKLRLCIEHKEKHVVVWDGCIGTGFIPCEDDPERATRRAITRAAAEMWRAQQEGK